MNFKYFILFIFIIILTVFDTKSNAAEECLNCHATGGEGSALHLSEEEFRNSVHGDALECVDCHVLVKYPGHENAKGSGAVDCNECHDRENLHGISGREADRPKCHACHGKHDILPSTEKESRVNPLHLPETCGRCHEDIDLTTKHELLYGKTIQLYQSSVHGQASLGGVYLAATCNDCHSSGGTAHKILGPGHPESSINHFNIPNTCGKCHKNIEMDFWEGMRTQSLGLFHTRHRQKK